MNSGKRADVRMKWLAGCGVVAPIFDVGILLWLGTVNPGYSHARQYISELGEPGRPYAAVFTVWCVLWGILFAGFAVALGRGFGGQKGSWLGPGALLVIVASSIVAGFFPCDPGGTAQTFSGHVHLIVGGWIGIPTTVLVPYLSWVAMRHSEAWRGYRSFTLAASVLLAVLAGWSVICHYGDLDRSACAVGVIQRLFMGTFYVWDVAVAIRLWRVGVAAEPVAVVDGGRDSGPSEFNGSARDRSC